VRSFPKKTKVGPDDSAKHEDRLDKWQHDLRCNFQSDSPKCPNLLNEISIQCDNSITVFKIEDPTTLLGVEAFCESKFFSSDLLTKLSSS
jgi:hypothetical protein